MFNNIEEKKRPKLSVVVIAFNNELYIEEALESLHEQTFQDIEIVVVNDFSTDRTAELIEAYILDKPKFRAIHLTENSGGCSTPRNTGINNSTGEYLMFLDGDDWYAIDACEKMVESISRTGSDFVAGQVIRTNNYEIWYHKQIYSRERTNINIREFNKLLFDTLSVNKIYQRSFLDKHKLRFHEGIHYEDILFTGKAYYLAESVSVIPEPVYYWRVVENADVKSITNRRFEFENFENRIIAHRYYDEFLNEIGAQKYQGEKNNKFLRHDLKLYTNDYLLFDEDYKSRFHNLIYKYMHEVMDEYEFLSLSEKDRIINYLLFIGDKKAFEDYLFYINNMPTKNNRIYNIGSSYYFKTDKPGKNHEKFLKISTLEIQFRLEDIKLDGESFSFLPEIFVSAIPDSEFNIFWMLKNRQTKDLLAPENSEDARVEFNIQDIKPGNYYLSLYFNHNGNIHRKLVKNTDISSLPNIKIEHGKISKRIFINQKNSFSIRVSPIKTVDQIKWKIAQRKLLQPDKKKDIKPRILEKTLKNLIPRLPVRSNWVLFESHMGKQYSDSPKYIYEELLSSGKKYKYIWSLQDPDHTEIPGNPVKVKRHSLKHFYYLNRAKYWVDNQGMAHLGKKKDSQVYVQTWHGTPLKRMGYDLKRLPSNNELARLNFQSASWDYLITPNNYTTKILKRAFRYSGSILETGYPRNDLLIKQPEKVIEETKNFYNIPSGKKVILFAPTFREWDPSSFQKVADDVLKLSRKLNEESVILLRLHYLLSNRMSQLKLPNNVINASNYQDIQELYLISDLLITDYSSVMFDYALLKRPIVLYCYDLEEYMTRRGMYFDFEKFAPGPIYKTIEEVIEFVSNEEKYSEYDERLEDFVEKFGSLEDGTASAQVVNQVFNRK
ncbi:bifunctional glycosyltransferase/CDP-glycerol:glycerophosphate glycerophosphotransferase [Planomicrobium okeanokoites]|uniref:bifunctional glycosyltransferase/CDP-glycerol:glycerophosphate glycerophosphotransferase n=1 Tax=Planomicrobium okeanokoites TaxID=244 RepID=UPI00248F49E6|nr:bifunctional glycosyltransferase family 2 protein/CDP-glycerol:glycerophosphate glycerophosphotransferase [Planomicrobium okeanokoites]